MDYSPVDDTDPADELAIGDFRPSMFDGSWHPPRENALLPEPGENLIGSGLLVKSDPLVYAKLRVRARLTLRVNRIKIRITLETR